MPHRNTLGIDRMVLAAGAVLQFPNQNRLVIDAGTCITYDFIDAKGCVSWWSYFSGYSFAL
jgi:pantothenate kinase type III